MLSILAGDEGGSFFLPSFMKFLFPILNNRNKAMDRRWRIVFWLGQNLNDFINIKVNIGANIHPNVKPYKKW